MNEEWISRNSSSIQRRLAWLRARLQGDRERYLSDDDDEVSALAVTQSRFGLSEFETNCLFLCAAVEFDTSLFAADIQIPEVLSRPYPTPALCLKLFDQPQWDLLSPERPLKRYRLVNFDRQPMVPLVESPMTLDLSVINYLRGLPHRDERLAWFISDSQANPDNLSLTQIEQVQNTLKHITTSRSSAAILQITGPRVNEKLPASQFIADHFGLSVSVLDVANLPSNVDEIDILSRLWNREHRLLSSMLYIDGLDDLSDVKQQSVISFLSRTDGIVFLGLREKSLTLPGMAQELAGPSPLEQKTAWASAIPDTYNTLASKLSAQFDLSLAEIREITERCETSERQADLNTDLWNYCRQMCTPALGHFAQRINQKATWQDLVLPDETMNLLRQISNQVHYRGRVLDDWGFRKRLNRGFGLTTLFSGESGTGKTMAAEVLAGDLKLDLYRIDLSSIVNKYIGETEKNLRKVFDAAERGGVILFFDEADALFGKRSEVKDSHDRYANIEVNYLLQRLESFSGLAILATNNKSNMDQAFLRRLRFVVDFSFPDLIARREIWTKIFPQDVPTSNIDAGQLARLQFSGGNIQNIALNAAYLAAADSEFVDMNALLTASRDELVKTQKPLTIAGISWPHAKEVSL